MKKFLIECWVDLFGESEASKKRRKRKNETEAFLYFYLKESQKVDAGYVTEREFFEEMRRIVISLVEDDELFKKIKCYVLDHRRDY